jgi:hypothetical protein
MKQRDGAGLDRREFIVAAGAIAVAYAPIVAAVDVAATSAAGEGGPVVLEDWTIDDMWGVYPRPHEAIGFGRARDDGALAAALDPIDAGLVA